MSDATEVNTQLNRAPEIGTPTVSRVANSTSELTITATATDEDAGDTLTYKLLKGTSANDTNPTELSLEPENIEGKTVTFKDTALSMDTYYWYKIKVSDGTDSTTSENYSSERTWCKAEWCEGVAYDYLKCDVCDGTKNVECPDGSDGKTTCTNVGCVDGKVSVTCTETTLTYFGGYTDGIIGYTYCEYCGKQVSRGRRASCSKCGYVTTTYWCGPCNAPIIRGIQHNAESNCSACRWYRGFFV